MKFLFLHPMSAECSLPPLDYIKDDARKESKIYSPGLDQQMIEDVLQMNI